MRKASLLVENKLLCALPPVECHQLLSKSEEVRLVRGTYLYQPYDLIDFVYFPFSVISFLTETIDGKVIEVGLVGREGMIGSWCLVSRLSPYTVLVQATGRALKVTAATMKTAFKESELWRNLLLTYTQRLLVQTTQSIVCNRFHQTEKRLARWLLMFSDRLGSDVLLITHERLSQSLGTRRASITQALRQLDRVGVIRHSRGRIAIVNRSALQFYACECCKPGNSDFEL